MIWRKRSSTRCPSQDELAASFLSAPDRYEDHRHGCTACSRSWTDVQQVSWQLAETLSTDPQDLDPVDGACPDVAAWATLAGGRVPDWARLALVEHMADCDKCSILWNYLIDVEIREKETTGPEIESEDPPTDEHGRPSRTLRLLVAAAGLATLLIYVVSPPPAIESGGAERWRGPAPLLDSEVQWPVETDPPFIQWQPWPGADSFRLRVWDFEGNLLFDQYLEGTSLRWHFSIEDLHPGTRYWLVEAIQTGRVVAKGEIGVLTIPSGGLPRSPVPR